MVTKLPIKYKQKRINISCHSKLDKKNSTQQLNKIIIIIIYRLKLILFEERERYIIRNMATSSSSLLSSTVSLKEDIKLLEKLFLKKLNKSTSSSSSSSSSNSSINSNYNNNSNNSCFRIISANLDELVCEFADPISNKKYRINANISEMYPQTPPVWSYENDDVAILDIIEKLSTTSNENDNRVIIISIINLFNFKRDQIIYS